MRRLLLGLVLALMPLTALTQEAADTTERDRDFLTAFLEDSLCVTNLDFFGMLPPEQANTVVCKSGVLAE